MNDTSPAIQEKYRTMLMQRSGAERLKMGCSMFDTARKMMRASLNVSTEGELKVALFQRTYGNDFDQATALRIKARLAHSRHGD